MSEGSILFWPVVFGAVAVCGAALLGGMVLAFWGACRRSRKWVLSGALVVVLSSSAALPVLFLWLDQFHHARLPSSLVRYGWPAGVALGAFLLVALLRAGRNERPQAASHEP